MPALSLYLPLLISASFFALIFDSPNHPILGLLAFIPLLRVAQVLKPIRACLTGGLWGAAFFLFSGLRDEAVFAPTVASFVLVTLVPALYTAFGAWVTRRAGFSPFLLAVGWILVECSLQPLSLSNGLVAASQSTGLLATVGGVFGYAWVAFLVVYVGAWFLRAISRVRLALILARSQAGLDEICRWVWLVHTALTPVAVPCAAHPRAPPHPG